MPEPIEESEAYEGEESPDTVDPKFLERLKELHDRCLTANISYEEEVDGPLHHVTIHLQAGRVKRPLFISELTEVEELLSCPFEKVVFLSDYDAFCSYEEGWIDASVTGLGTTPLTGLLRRRLFGIMPSENFDPSAHSIELESVHPSSIKAHLLLAGHRLSKVVGRPGPSLQLKGLSISSHDQAIDLLETVSDGLFFEIDTRFNLALGIRKFRRPTNRPFLKSDDLGRKALQIPQWRYDKQPMSLYWYGRSATSMPLLQFLAYYQAIEFYFPIYSQNEAIKQVRSLLKSPSFSIHDDSDISRLLTAIQLSRAGGFGDERSQLRATIQSCVDAQDLRSFLTSDERTSEFYSSQSHWKEVSKEKVPINKADADLRISVADRIYDIRCKIVHSKADGGPTKAELLLPFSKEAELLSFDIELSRYVARSVLVASSAHAVL